MSKGSLLFARCSLLYLMFVASGVGCGKPISTSTIATATGGAIGAGLGALIGSQTGSAGAGLAVGTAAGAGTGALIGNMFEKQEQLVAQKDEAFIANQRRIKVQQEEIETLRRLHGDVPPSGDGRGMVSRSLPSGSAQVASSSRLVNDSVAVREIERRSAGRVNSSSTGVVESSKENLGKRLIEKEIVSGTSVSGDGGNVRGLVDDGFDEVVKQEKPSVVKSGFSDGSSAGDCAQAGAEIRSAMNESQSKEKLFRYRRALRMCPDKAEFHSALGELYLDMNRIHDAEYEFNEAVRLDPSDKKAKANLAELNGE